MSCTNSSADNPAATKTIPDLKNPTSLVISDSERSDATGSNLQIETDINAEAVCNRKIGTLPRSSLESELESRDSNTKRKVDILGLQSTLLSNATSISQARSGANTPVSSPLEPVLVLASNALSVKNLNLEQIPVSVVEVQGVQTATSTVSSATTKVTQSEPSVSKSNKGSGMVIPAVNPTVCLATTDATLTAPSVGDGRSIVEVSMVPVSPMTPTPSIILPTAGSWDPFDQSERVTVTCRKNNAVFDRRKLGSGQRGKCIFFNNNWMTPSEFEVVCGLSTSKDWKRSIRCGGFTIQKLVSEGYLKPHSSLCSCAVCSDDDTVTCPVRLFQPYKRRKRGSTTSTSIPDKKPNIDDKGNITLTTLDPFLSNLNSGAESTMKFALAESQLIEQRMWWRLEEISNNLLDQAQKLKVAIEEAKMNSLNQRIVLMQKVISHFEREQVANSNTPVERTFFSQELNSSHFSSNHYNSNGKKIKAQSTKAEPVKIKITSSSQFCNTCGNHASSECTGCHKATYCSTACQEKDWLKGHSEVCQAGKITEQGEKNKESDVVVTCSPHSDSFVVVPTLPSLPNHDAAVAKPSEET